MVKHSARIIRAEYLCGYQLRIEFSDGAKKIIDFSRWLQGEVFRSLTDKREFKRFFISDGTVCWPNGAEIAPETLRSVENVAR